MRKLSSTPPPPPTAGAIFASSNCCIYVDGNTSFSDNFAQDDGGKSNVRLRKVPTVAFRRGFTYYGKGTV